MALAEPRESRLAEDLFNEHSRLVYAYCLRRLGSPEEAEDALQVTYLNACRSLMRGFEPDEAQAWLLRVAHNVCVSRIRSSSRRRLLERPQDLQLVEETVPAHLPADDELMGLEEALAGMPEQQRRAIVLREWHGLSYREVATELGLTQSAVEALIFRARRSLAQALETVRPRPRFVHAFNPAALLGSLKSALSSSVATGVAVAASATVIASAPIAADSAPRVFAEPAAVEAAAAPAAPAREIAEPAKTSFRVASGGDAARGRGLAKANGKGHGAAKAKGKAKREARRVGPPPHAQDARAKAQKASPASAAQASPRAARGGKKR